ncbi:hypothetical protein CFIMG_007725RA00001 [Ceratocystis fimbriata CBS 114723]|uniref:Erythromycin esterase n=1 Tax=Ceratocystis fimbriata CBS 114723 TaxID=1035309 RepID=A0A2C5WUJ4_9PEZI|nr:hypothetical protein CFIMG_007725RA00001 [Ceratocystis fimbriata CBS 114723]
MTSSTMTPPPRRRSARLASKSKLALTKATQPQATLSTVSEHGEPASAAGSSPRLPRPIPKEPQTSPVSKTRHQPSTPSTSVARPPASEMHPSKIHRPSLVPSSAIKHGFRDLNPTTRTEQLLAAAQATPTKSRETNARHHHAMPSSPFTFSVTHPSGVEKGLSNEALKIMDGLREEAAKIKAGLIADRERDREQAESLADRKFAQPKGKSNRYSAVHMAEFKKMDSIENHPSAFRAAPGRFTPVKALKRKPSKANLDDATEPTIRQVGIKRSPSKASLADEVAATPSTPSKIPGPGGLRSGISSVKRLKQKLEDDAATTRPVSRDGTNTSSAIPRPVSNGDSPLKQQSQRQPNSATSFGTPTKSGIARPTDFSSTIRLVRSASKSDLVAESRAPTQAPATPSAIPRSAASAATSTQTKASGTPGRFEHIKSILKKTTIPSAAPGTATNIMCDTAAQKSSEKTTSNDAVFDTPSKALTGSRLPEKVVTTPSHRLTKHSVNTPRLTTVTPTSHVSPSFKSAMKRVRMVVPGDECPTMESVLSKAETALEVKYPDLTTFSGLLENDLDMPDIDEAKSPAVPGTFSFRSDKTIDFGISKPSFGSSAGQASIRQVRRSVFGGLSSGASAGIPGGFPKSQLEVMPDAPTMSPTETDVAKDAGGSNKENDTPMSASKLDGKYRAISHGIGNKKRNRPSTDEDDQARDVERGNKKRRNEDLPLGISVTSTQTATTAAGSFETRPKTPSASVVNTTTTMATATPTRTPGYAAATSAVKNKEFLTRKIRKPVRPTEKLKTAAVAKTVNKSASATPSRVVPPRAGSSRIGAPTPSRSTAPTAASRATATANPSRTKTTASGAAASPARSQVRATPSISASRLAMLATPKRR